MDKIIQCVAKFEGPKWILSAYTQMRLGTNAFGDDCYLWIPESRSELWLGIGDMIFVSDTFAGILSFAARLRIDIVRAARETPGGFSKFYSSWFRGDFDATVIEPPPEPGALNTAHTVLWNMGVTTFDALTPQVHGNQLIFHTHFMEPLGQSRFRHELMRFDVSLTDFSSTTEVIGEVFD